MKDIESIFSWKNNDYHPVVELPENYDVLDLSINPWIPSKTEYSIGKYDEDRRCLTPQRLKKSLVSSAINSGPPSLLISSGTPKVAKTWRRAWQRRFAPASTFQILTWTTSGQPDNRSTTTK